MSIRLPVLFWCCAIALMVPAVSAPGQSGTPEPAAPQVANSAVVEVDSGSPRAAVLGYLRAARSGNYEAAAAWLGRSSPEVDARAEELAWRLREVLNVRLWLDIERISARMEGDLTDQLPPDLEQLGVIQTAGGASVAIRLARVAGVAATDPPRWVFSAATVAQVDVMFDALPDSWVRRYLPETLLTVGPLDIMWWQWIALVLLIPLVGFVGLLLGRPTRALLLRLVAQTETDFDDQLVAAARGPIILLWSVLASRVLLQWLALTPPAEAFVVELQMALAIVALFWVVLRMIGVLQEALPRQQWMAAHPGMRSLMPLAARMARLLVIALGALTVISAFGYPIATILAGLGIGGIALALGAQKSLEHFFGSVSIGVDQPFRVGDWVSVSGVQGEIEAIGLRSTRIRTMERTVVTIPNGSLAEAQSENFGARERIRLKATIGLEYGTPAAAIRRIRDEVEALLRAHPLTWPDRVQVRFSNFGSSSLDIELFCWLQTKAIDEFRAAREELFLGIMEVVERNGASFAFPTQTIHLAGGARPPQPL